MRAKASQRGGILASTAAAAARLTVFCEPDFSLKTTAFDPEPSCAGGGHRGPKDPNVWDEDGDAWFGTLLYEDQPPEDDQPAQDLFEEQFELRRFRTPKGGLS